MIILITSNVNTSTVSGAWTTRRRTRANVVIEAVSIRGGSLISVLKLLVANSAAGYGPVHVATRAEPLYDGAIGRLDVVFWKLADHLVIIKSEWRGRQLKNLESCMNVKCCIKNVWKMQLRWIFTYSHLFYSSSIFLFIHLLSTEPSLWHETWYMHTSQKVTNHFAFW